MVQFYSRKEYGSYVITIWALIFVAFVVSLLLKPVPVVIAVLFFAICSVVLLLTSFTDSIKVDADKVIIEYYRFFSIKKKVIPLSGVEYKLVKRVSFRGGVYFELQIFGKKKLVYTIDSRDGFEKEELEEIANLK